jgi:CHAT domain-containing protein
MKAWRVKMGLIVMVLAVASPLSLSLVAFGQAQTAPERRSLPAVAEVESEIVGNAKISYDADLKAGEFFQVRVKQKDAEIQLRLLDAKGTELASMSSPREIGDLEILSFVSTETASYTLEVSLLKVESGKGHYTIRREPSRAATARDRRRVEVERLFADAMSVRNAKGPSAVAAVKFSEALKGWLEVGDEYMAQLSKQLYVRFQARANFVEARKMIQGPERETQKEGLQRAISKFEEAARLFKESGESVNEAAAFLGAAVAAQDMGDFGSAIVFVEQTLPIFLDRKDKPLVASLLDILVTFHLILDDTDSAIKRLMEARSLYIELESPSDVARTENDIGGLYLVIGKRDEAHKFLDSSMQLRKKHADRCGLSASLSNLGYYYYADDKAKAQDFLLNQALPLYTSAEECDGGKGQTLINIGKLYYDLGANHLALDYLAKAKEALDLRYATLRLGDQNDFSIKVPTVINRRDTATALNFIGAANFASAKYQEASVSLRKSNPAKAAEAEANAKRLYQNAQSSYREALRLYREIPDKKHEATVMTNIGVVQSASGQTDEAVKTFDEALEVSRSIDDKDGEAITLINIGDTYLARSEQRKALEFYNRAIPLLKASGDTGGEAVALAGAMVAWSKIGNRRMAIFCGKQAINMFQDLRQTARGLDTEIQKDYLRGMRGAYQQLAELLIEEGLYAQAIQILNLYEDQQFFDFDRKASIEHAKPTQREHDWAQRYETQSKPLVQLRSEIQSVKRQIAYRQPTAEKKAQLQNLNAEFTTAVAAFDSAVKQAEKEFFQPPVEADKVAEVESVTLMQKALDVQQSGPKAFALYTLIGSDKFYVLLLKPSGIKTFSHPINAADLNGRIIKAQSDLQNNRFPAKARASSSDLYNIILGANSTDGSKRSLEAELKTEAPDTLLWALDGYLSSIPMAALYDARNSQYLVEKYQNVVFTRADAKRILRERKPWTTAIGFGKSTASEVKCETTCDNPPCDNSLIALRLVSQEMSAIFRGTPQRPALLKGPMMLDDKFTRESMLTGMKRDNPSLVHIASHFCFQPGDAAGSFLLLGNDKKFSLSEMRTYPDLYAGIDLLVLSACRTGALEPNQRGQQIDSLAELSQRLGAASVIATLWNADDVGTSRLMVKFYALHKRYPDLTKAELLRRSQLSLLKKQEASPDTNWDHPYYWAPFVLYGSFR